ncbi:MAG: hypothetical protein M9890_08630 [Thermomicrobiales bacterium]|nr:hypothetical protein [Thermomicrobiales bacterium]
MRSSAADRWGIIGHDAQVDALSGAVESGHVSHAYLVTGPIGVGKTTLALALARALNCTADVAARPCGTCEQCRRASRGSHPDVTFVDLDWQDAVIPTKSRTVARQALSIDSVKFLRQDIVTRPIFGRWKLQIVADAGLLSGDAADAYLKTIEEPPPFAVIVLLAESAERVSETIRSRCRVIELGGVPRLQIASALAARDAGPELADRLARAAHGRIGWALEMAASAEARLSHRELVEAAYEHVTTPLGRVELTGAIARDFTRRRAQTFQLVDTVTGIWRDALLYRVGLAEEVTYADVGDRLAGWSANYELRDLYRALHASRQCLVDLSNNVQARIALHAMVMQWPD